MCVYVYMYVCVCVYVSVYVYERVQEGHVQSNPQVDKDKEGRPRPGS